LFFSYFHFYSFNFERFPSISAISVFLALIYILCLQLPKTSIYTGTDEHNNQNILTKNQFQEK